MTEPPVLDQLDTRRLETREVIRSFVKQSEVVDAAASRLLLRTEAETTTNRTRLPEGCDAAEFAASAGAGETVSGSLQVARCYDPASSSKASISSQSRRVSIASCSSKTSIAKPAWTMT